MKWDEVPYSLICKYPECRRAGPAQPVHDPSHVGDPRYVYAPWVGLGFDNKTKPRLPAHEFQAEELPNLPGVEW